MKRRGKKDADIQEACKLFSQIARVIESKQLGPTVRTQYMRTAFQIPFDSTVRISLDTNLAMVRETKLFFFLVFGRRQHAPAEPFLKK